MTTQFNLSEIPKAQRTKFRLKAAGSIEKQIFVVQGNLIQIAADAIVTAANEALAGGGGVDGAVHRGAGPGLMVACRMLPSDSMGRRCPVGVARVTPAFRLPYQAIIHAVGPRWQGGQSGEAEALAQTIASLINLAEDLHFQSLVMPAFSTGAFGYPVNRAAKVHFAQILQSLSHTKHLQTVIIAALQNKVWRQFVRMGASFNGLKQDHGQDLPETQ